MSIKVAMKLFEQMPGATKWVPRQGFKNADICYKKRFAAGKAVGIDKVVTRNDGVKVIGHYSLNGDLTGGTLTSARGKIETNFGAQNFDKVIHINTNLGEEFTRLGHKGQPERYIDCYGNSSKRYDYIDDKGNTYKKLVDYVKNGNDKFSQLIEELKKQWI